jgi:iron complex transport system ATP-binding protein
VTGPAAGFRGEAPLSRGQALMPGGQAPLAPLLAARGLACAYGPRTVLADFDLAVPPGRVVALLGANGAGKTTALRAFARLHRPSAGRVLLGGDDLWRLAPREAARRLAYLPQGEEAAGPLTVEEAALLGRVPHRGWLAPYRAEDRAAVAAVLARLGLAGLADRPLDTLSGGERRRALLARALVQQAEVLVLDEPTAHLDLRHQVELLELLRALAAERGLAVVASFHDLNQAARTADELVLLAEGRVLARGPAARVLTAEHLERAYGLAVEIVADPVSGVPLVVPARQPAPPAAAADLPPSNHFRGPGLDRGRP